MYRIISFKNSLIVSFLFIFFSVSIFFKENWVRPHVYQRYVLENITSQEFLALYDDLEERDTLLQGLDEWSAWFRDRDLERNTYLYDIDYRVSFYVEDSLGNTVLFLGGITTDMSSRKKRRDFAMYNYHTPTLYCVQAQYNFEKCVLNRLWPYKKDYIQGFLAWYSSFCFRNFFWIIGFLVLFVYLCFFYEKRRSFESLFRIIENGEWHRLKRGMNRKERPGLPYCITSILLYFSSFFFYAFYVDLLLDDLLLHHGTYGVECFIEGLFGFVPALVIEILHPNFIYLWLAVIWLANPLYWISTYYYLRKRKRGVYYAISSIVLAVLFLFVPMGVKMPGYYLWLSSFVVMLIALIIEYMSRKTENSHGDPR